VIGCLVTTPSRACSSRSLPAPAAAWPRQIADLVCSQVFLALIAPWFFALQHRALALTGTTRELTP
jgi:hypothetical protein